MANDTSRLFLKIETASPVILLPVSSYSPDLLVCNLGQLSIRNCFKCSNDPETISIPIDAAAGNSKMLLCKLLMRHLNATVNPF